MRALGIDLPRPGAIARHAGPRLIEATVIPLMLFYAALSLAGLWPAILTTMVWQYAAVGRRLLRASGVPAILVLGVVGITVRTVVTAATGSAFIYFLQPTLAGVMVGFVFLVSVPAGRPLCAKLARDFVPLPDELMARPSMVRYFRQITLLWGLTNVANAAMVFTLLETQPLTRYLILSKTMSLCLTCSTVAASAVWFALVVRADKKGNKKGKRTKAPVTLPVVHPVALATAAA